MDYTSEGKKIVRYKFTEDIYQQMATGCLSNPCIAASWFVVTLCGTALIIAGALIFENEPQSWGVPVCITLCTVGVLIFAFGIAMYYALMERNRYVHNCGVLCCACTKSNKKALEQIYLSAK